MTFSGGLLALLAGIFYNEFKHLNETDTAHRAILVTLEQRILSLERYRERERDRKLLDDTFRPHSEGSPPPPEL